MSQLDPEVIRAFLMSCELKGEHQPSDFANMPPEKIVETWRGMVEKNPASVIAFSEWQEDFNDLVKDVREVAVGYMKGDPAEIISPILDFAEVFTPSSDYVMRLTVDQKREYLVTIAPAYAERLGEAHDTLINWIWDAAAKATYNEAATDLAAAATGYFEEKGTASRSLMDRGRKRGNGGARPDSRNPGEISR